MFRLQIIRSLLSIFILVNTYINLKVTRSNSSGKITKMRWGGHVECAGEIRFMQGFGVEIGEKDITL